MVIAVSSMPHESSRNDHGCWQGSFLGLGLVEEDQRVGSRQWAMNRRLQGTCNKSCAEAAHANRTHKRVVWLTRPGFGGGFSKQVRTVSHPAPANRCRSNAAAGKGCAPLVTRQPPADAPVVLCGATEHWGHDTTARPVVACGSCPGTNGSCFHLRRGGGSGKGLN